MNLHKTYTAGLVFILAVTLRGVSAAEATLQDPPKEPGSQEQTQPSTEEQRKKALNEEQRKKALKLLREQAQRAGEARKNETQQKDPQQKETQLKEAQQKETQQKEQQKARVTPFGTLPPPPQSATEETKKKEAQQKGQVTPFGTLPAAQQGGAAGTAAPTPAPQAPQTPPAQAPQTPPAQAPQTPPAQAPQTPPVQAPQTPPVQAPQTPPAPTPPPASAGQRPSLASDQVQLNFDNAELFDFVNQIADTLGITPIIIDPNVKGSVNIHSSAPLPKDDVFPLFNLILKTNNAALVKQGNIYQIVPISEALRKGLEIIDHRPSEPAARPEGASPAGKATQPPGGAPPTQPPQDSGSSAPAPSSPQPQTPATAGATPQAGAQPQAPRLSTHVLRAEFVSVKDLIEPLKLFMTEGGVIMPYERLNMLIVTDYTDNVQKIMEVIRLLDDAFINPELVELIGVKYNASADIADDLRKIFGSGAKDSATGIYFLSLDRMNAILVMANSKRAMAEFKRWVEKLDATAGRSVQTFVYTVENSTASNIMLILTALFGGEGGSAGGRSGAEGGAGGAGTAGGVGGAGGSAARTGSFAQQTAGPFGGGGYGGGAYGGGAYGGGAYGGFGGGGYGGYGGGYGGYGGGYGGYGGGYGGYGGYGGGYGGGVFGGGSQLGPRLNQQPSMSSQIFRGGALTGLQDNVRVVANDINNTLVIQSSAADYAYLLDIIKKLDVLPRQVIIDARIFEIDLTDALKFGIGGQLQKTSTDPKDVPRATTGAIGTDGTLSASTFAFVGNSREILLQLDALRTKTKVRILEAPSVLALDGTLARIVVGGEVPYPAGTFFGGTGLGTSTVQYRDTGISLIVMPRISGSGVVTLDIAQEVSAPGAAVPVGETSALSFNKSMVSTTLAVKDGEMVAIAGLIRDSNTLSRSGVPFFSEIPIIGSLFGRTNRTANRTELLILISPHVIKTPERFTEMTQELKDSLRNVRKFVDKRAQEHLEDLEDARKERSHKEEKRKKSEERQKESQPPPAANPKK